MKAEEIKMDKAASGKARQNSIRPKSNLKAALGKYKDAIIEKDNCWDEDLKRTIPHR